MIDTNERKLLDGHIYMMWSGYHLLVKQIRRFGMMVYSCRVTIRSALLRRLPPPT